MFVSNWILLLPSRLLQWVSRLVRPARPSIIHVVQKMPQTTVSLHPAFMWRCPQCQHVNLTGFVIAELPPNERMDIAKAIGMIDEYETELPESMCSALCTTPDNVTCQKCHNDYDATAEPGTVYTE